jgi:hypothetical protein
MAGFDLKGKLGFLNEHKNAIYTKILRACGTASGYKPQGTGF